MGVENGDKTAALPKGEGKDASDKFRADLDVMSSLQLKDPAKQTTSDLLANGYINITPLDSSPMNDPQKFLDVASKIVKADPDGGLTRADLKAVSDNPAATANQKTVALELQKSYDQLASPDENSALHFASSFTKLGRTIQQDGLDRLKETTEAAKLFAKHPELKDPETLAATLESIKDKLPNHDYGLLFSELDSVSKSDKFTEQERAAASLAKANFNELSTLSEDGDKGWIDKHDIEAIARNGKPAEKAEVKPGCEDHTSVAGNAVKWGAGVGVVSKVSGSDQSGANAAVAAISAALAATIKNEICEK